MTGAGVATAATALITSQAVAAQPPIGKQAPGWYRYKVGTHESQL